MDEKKKETTDPLYIRKFSRKKNFTIYIYILPIINFFPFKTAVIWPAGILNQKKKVFSFNLYGQIGKGKEKERDIKREEAARDSGSLIV